MKKLLLSLGALSAVVAPVAAVVACGSKTETPAKTNPATPGTTMYVSSKTATELKEINAGELTGKTAIQLDALFGYKTGQKFTYGGDDATFDKDTLTLKFVHTELGHTFKFNFVITPASEVQAVKTAEGQGFVASFLGYVGPKDPATYLYGQELGEHIAAVLNAKTANTIDDSSTITNWNNGSLSALNSYGGILVDLATDGKKAAISALTTKDITDLEAIFELTKGGTDGTHGAIISAEDHTAKALLGAINEKLSTLSATAIAALSASF